MSAIKIHIVEDHDMFREGIRYVLAADDEFEVIAESSNGAEFLGKLNPESLPDIVLMDIDMPVLDGMMATQKALMKFPGLKIITLSMHGDHGHYKKMIDAGAKGFVLKDSGVNELTEAIHEVLNDNAYFSHKLLMNLVVKNDEASKLSELVKELDITDREMDVLKLISQGMTNQQIADKLFISIKTVEGHKSKLMIKTDTSNAVSLVVYAIKNDLINL